MSKPVQPQEGLPAIPSAVEGEMWAHVSRSGLSGLAMGNEMAGEKSARAGNDGHQQSVSPP